MLTSIQIKNYAIIENLNLEFSEGLTIITGETGAGKSILLGALGLVMGRRADKKTLFLKDTKCIVEACFDVSKYDIKDFFETHELDYEDEVIVRREISTSGKSRAFVNDTPVKLNILQQLSGSLVDLHQQFDTRDINEVSFQLRMVDALAGHEKELNQYKRLFKKYQANVNELKQLEERQAQSVREKEFLDFQLNEFNEVNPLEGEQSALESDQKRLSGSEDIKKSLGAVKTALIDGENALIAKLGELTMLVRNVQNIHPDVKELSSRFDGIELELNDLAKEFENLIENTEHDPQRILEISTRLDEIYKLQHKHRAKDESGLFEIWEKLKSERNGYGDTDKSISRLQEEIKGQEEELGLLSKKLTKGRTKVLKPFEKKIAKLLGQLGMEHARIQIQATHTETFTPTGQDIISFLFAPNQGSTFQSIRDVASGGELSRLTLAVKSLVADAIPLPTLIFDEIDTGISGDVALKMGKILKELSSRHQVVSITHTPQIAVQAHRHYFVYKKPEKKTTHTRVRLLDPEERIAEVATMLSGSPPSLSAIENAKELLGV